MSIAAVENSLNSAFLERRDEIRGLLIGLVAKQHVLLYGPPGTGKSALVRAMALHFTGIRRFEKLLTKFTAPEEIEGPPDMTALMAGRYVRCRDGHISHVEIAFLDEIFKANSAILNTVLSILNERIYHEEGRAHPAALHSLVGASNELPDGPELRAFADRFALRYETQYLSRAGRAVLHRMPDCIYSPDKNSMMTLSDLEALQAEARKVSFSPSVNDQYDKLLDSADREGLALSDRAMRQAKTLMQANAAIEGRDSINDDDLEILIHVLWKEPKDKTKARQLVNSVVNPLKAKAAELLDTAIPVYQKIKPMFDQAVTNANRTAAMEANTRLNAVQDQIKELIRSYDGANVSPLEKALAEVDKLTENVVLWMMGKKERMHNI